VDFGDDAVIPDFNEVGKQNSPSNTQLLPPTSQANEEGIATIDIMVLYTPELTTERGGIDAVKSRVNHLINVANQAYIDSKMLISLRLVHSEEIDVNNDANTNATLDNLKDGVGIFSNVLALREDKGADLVILMRDFVDAHRPSCGVAFLLGDKNTGTTPQNHREAGYSVIHDGETPLGYFCTDTTFAHELGHNFGFAHDRANSGGTGLFSYSYGYDIPEKFATIMSYARPRINKFSNPNTFCNEGACNGDEALGILDGNNSANNARSGNNIRFDIAAFYDEKVNQSEISPDCNGDGSVSILDVVCVINAVLTGK
jgi:hypothetical protein